MATTPSPPQLSVTRTGNDVVDRNLDQLTTKLNPFLRRANSDLQTLQTSVASLAGGTPPTGPAGGDLTGTYPNPTLAVVNSDVGTFGDATHVPQITVNAKGQITAVVDITLGGQASPGIGVLVGTGVNATIRPLSLYSETLLGEGANTLVGTAAGTGNAWSNGIPPNTEASGGSIINTDSSDPSGPLIEFTTGAGLDNVAYLTVGLKGSGNTATYAWGPVMQGRVLGISTVTTRVWVGIATDGGDTDSANMPLAAVNAGIPYCALRYDSSLSPNWFACVSDGGGTNHQEQDTGIAFSAATPALPFSIDGSQVPGGGGVTFAIGSAVVTITGTGIPATTAAVYSYFGIGTEAAVAASVAFGSWRMGRST